MALAWGMQDRIIAFALEQSLVEPNMLVVDVEKLVSELMFAPPSQEPKQGIRHSLLSTCLMERFHWQKSSGVPVCQLYFTMYVLAFFTHLGNNGALCQKMLWA
jgi:hypothetical protein